MMTRLGFPRHGSGRPLDARKPYTLGIICIALILTSQPVSANGPEFTRMRSFEVQYAYLDVPAGAPAQDWFRIHAKRSGDGWIVDAVGSNPKIAASVRTCRKTFRGHTVGPGRLRATDPSGEFGTFELRREGEYVRLVLLAPGDCAREGLYLIPQVQD